MEESKFIEQPTCIIGQTQCNQSEHIARFKVFSDETY